MDEVGPRTLSGRAAIYVTGNTGHSVPAVLVIYSYNQRGKKKTERNKVKEASKRIPNVMPISSLICATSSS